MEINKANTESENFGSETNHDYNDFVASMKGIYLLTFAQETTKNPPPTFHEVRIISMEVDTNDGRPVSSFYRIKGVGKYTDRSHFKGALRENIHCQFEGCIDFNRKHISVTVYIPIKQGILN